MCYLHQDYVAIHLSNIYRLIDFQICPFSVIRHPNCQSQLCALSMYPPLPPKLGHLITVLYMGQEMPPNYSCL